eukprot:jgi/Orpsp1_1/1188557/evm.model.d7180000065728.1
MSTRPLNLTDENLPPRKRQRNFMNYDSNYINNSFSSPENGLLKNEINNELTFKSEQVKKEDLEKNISKNEENEENEEKNDHLRLNNENDIKEVNNSQNDDQLDIIGNVSEEEEQSEQENSESEEEIKLEEIEKEEKEFDESEEEIKLEEIEKEEKEFDENTKAKLRSEAHELGFDAFMEKYGYYSARSLIALFDVELPPQLDSYKNFELIPLLKIIMARFNRRRQKLKTVNTID